MNVSLLARALRATVKDRGMATADRLGFEQQRAQLSVLCFRSAGLNMIDAINIAAATRDCHAEGQTFLRSFNHQL